MKKTWAVAAAIFFASASANAETRAFTALDDARACAPVAGGWAVATGGGLAVVESSGKKHVLTALDGLPETRVYAVTPTATGLWVGTEAGAALVDRTTWKVTRTVATPAVRAIHVTGAETYFGTWGSGVYRLSDGATIASAGTRVSAIAEFQGAIYAAFADGPLAVLDANGFRAIGGSPTRGQSLAARGTDLVLGDLDGLHHVRSSVGPAFASVDARALAFDGDRLLAGTFGTGLVAGAALRGEPIVPRFVRGVAVDGHRRCAATTEGLYVDEGNGWHALPLGGPSSNDVTAVAADGDRVAIASFDHGASISERGVVARVMGLAADETVNALMWQGHDRLWLGTAHGLVLADKTGAFVRRVLPGATVRALTLSGDRVVAGTEDGVYFVDGDEAPTPLALAKKHDLASPMHATWALANMSDGTLVIGTMTGLYWGKGGKFERASVSGGELADDWITALVVDGREVLVGSYAGGVTRFEPATRHAVQLGGGYVNAGGLALRDGKPVVATMAGLLEWDDKSWKNANITLGRDVTGVAFTASETWIATRRGIAIVSHPR